MAQTIIVVKYIDDYIKEHNLSKAQFCKQCGISLFTLRKLYKGEKIGKMKTGILLKLSVILNVTCDTLLNRKS